MFLSPHSLLQTVSAEHIGLWFLLANGVAYGMFYADKRASIDHGWRISEKMLLLWCALGGSMGGYLAMRRFRHKTQKLTFRRAFFMIVILQIAALGWIVLADR